MTRTCEYCGDPEFPSWYSIEGNPVPLGATWLPGEDAFNFALYSKHATQVTLLLFNEGDVFEPALSYELDPATHKSGRVWHCRLSREVIASAVYYAYQIDGPKDGSGYDLHAFDRDKVLFDPYAKEIVFPESFDRQAAIGPGPNMGKAPLGVLVRNGQGFHWGDDRSPMHEHDLIIYEMHVRGFTQHESSGVPEPLRGTFLGVIEKIPYLKELGVTAVELMPVHQFDPQEGNYWGYMPLNFFAPHSGYAVDPQRAVTEFREMVRELHRAGIEVILDVVFNHTGEAGTEGPCYSLKGIDNSSYYITTGYPSEPYANYSGTGNTLHTKNRHVNRMILDSMRHWVTEYHIDGFRFDLAAIFNRRLDGSVSTDEAGLVAAIRADPDLQQVRLIAEPWDAAGLQQLGRAFPGKRWWQWNAFFRDDIRRFVNGEKGFVAMAMRRLYGSDDLFPDNLIEACHPYQSVNYINSHDGFTLYDHVSYNERHNWANGEEGRDGHRDNFSWNCGWEGDEDVPEEVMTLRLRQVRNLLTMLFLSNGTPMFRSGDEFLQTQHGNNNPYNQDNEISWLDWGRLDQFDDFHRFVRKLIEFRKKRRTLSRSRFWREDVSWHGTEADIDWTPSSSHFAYFLRGESQRDLDLYVMINFETEDLNFTIQHGETGEWQVAINTANPSPEDIYDVEARPALSSREVLVRARSVVVLTSHED